MSEHQFADSRALSAPFSQRLASQRPRLARGEYGLAPGGPSGVAVADLPRLYLDPAPFKHAPAILAQHATVVDGMRENLQSRLKGIV